jgi:hypothetical protein
MFKRKWNVDNGNKCAFCALRSITEKNQKRYVEFKAWCSTGLRCNNCCSPRLICELCIFAIVQTAIERKDSDILSDPWIKELKKYVFAIVNKKAQEKGDLDIQSDDPPWMAGLKEDVEMMDLGGTTKDVEQNFKGHCCDFDVKAMRTEEEAERFVHQTSDMVYDGGLVLLGHGVLIETDCNAVDVNAMGPDALAGIEKGIVHGVIDSSLARELQAERYAPKDKDSNFKTMTYNIVVPSVSGSGPEQNVSHYTIRTNANNVWTHFLS